MQLSMQKLQQLRNETYSDAETDAVKSFKALDGPKPCDNWHSVNTRRSMMKYHSKMESLWRETEISYL